MAYTAQPTGFLANIVRLIRDYTDDPSDTPKWTTDRLYPLMQSAWGKIIQDVNGLSAGPIVARFSLSVSASTQSYMLPPNVGTILRIGRIDSTTNRIYGEIMPRGRLAACGPGWSIEGGRILRFDPKLSQTETLRVEYIPNGELLCHLGTATASDSDNTTTTFQLDTSPDDGYYDSRPNAYVGSMLRVLSKSDATIVPQERLITAVSTTFVATVEPAFDSTLASGSGTYTYEIVPVYFQMFTNAVALEVVRMIHAIENRERKFNGITQLYSEEMRSLRSMLLNMEGRLGSLSLGTDNPEHPRVSNLWGLW